MLPPGALPLPKDAALRLVTPIETLDYKPPQPVKGVLIGLFGPAQNKKKASRPTHAVVVNLDYDTEALLTIAGPRRLELFDAASTSWSKSSGKSAQLRLPPGGGKLVRIQRP